MNVEKIEKIKTHLHSAISSLYRMEGPTLPSDLILYSNAMSDLRQILSLVNEIKQPKEIGISVRVDIGDTVEKLGLCEKACQEVILAKIKLDKLLGEEYGPQWDIKAKNN